VHQHIALGQRIGAYTIEIMGPNGTWTTVVTGTSIGYKRTDRLATAVETRRVGLRITQANAVPLVESLQVLGSQTTV